MTWVGIHHAGAESALLTKVRAGENVKVVLLGTSLTDNGTWPTSLQNWLTQESPGPGTVTVINHAASGQASDHGLAVQTPAALLDNPDAVFIEFSMNDAATSKNITLQQATDNLNAMINQFKNQNPNVIIVLQTMNNTDTDTSPFSPRPNLNAYYQIYRDAAVTHGAILIDHYPNWLNVFNNQHATWDTYMADPVHPNQLGQDSVLVPELQAVLGPPSLPTTPPLGTDILAMWDSWNDTVTPYAPDASAIGFTASVSTNDNRIHASFGSTDGTYGTLSGAATGLSGLLVRQTGGNLTVTVSLTNNTGEAYYINGLNFDFGPRVTGPNSFTLTYTGGGLGPAGTQIGSETGLATIVGPSQGTSEGDYYDYDYSLGSILTDHILDHGETAIFQIVLTGHSSAQASSIIDNIAILGEPVVKVVPSISSFNYDDSLGSIVLSIAGQPSTAYKIVRADDLDFSNPDQDPVPLNNASVGTLNGNTVITDTSGKATIQLHHVGVTQTFFIRMEEIR